MALKQILHEALQQPMSRRQFLAQVGSLFLALIGVGAVLRALESRGQVGRGQVFTGYGSMPYGGRAEH